MNHEANKQIVQSYAAMWNDHKTKLATEILANDYIDHAHPGLVGPQAIAAVADKTLQAMPDFHIQLESMVAEGDLVAFKETITMTRQGEKHTLNGMGFVRIAGGKMAERWTCYDRGNQTS